MLDVVFDTNVFVSGLRSKQGASFKLLSLIDSGIFRVNISVPLLFEYESVLKRERSYSGLTIADIDDILNYVCSVSRRSKIFYLWRPYLKDPSDDFLLELAVESQCRYIVTHNTRDFAGSERFDIGVVTPKDFLRIIGGSL